MTPLMELSRMTGIGLRLPHLAELVATLPADSLPGAGWVEIHPENFVATPHALELLEEVARHLPVSLHTVGISVGSHAGVDQDHLMRLAALVERIGPFLVSGHLAWSTQGGHYLNDLLPIPYNAESLQIACRHIRKVQETLGCPFLIENPSSYLGFRSSTMQETEFLEELVLRTDCRLLCDVSNIFVSAHNMGYDPYAYLDSFPSEPIAEFHLGGFASGPDAALPGDDVWIDTHDRVIDEGAWDLYAYAIGRFGMRPTLIEWDCELPRLADLLHEAVQASAIAIGALTMAASGGGDIYARTA